MDCTTVWFFMKKEHIPKRRPIFALAALFTFNCSPPLEILNEFGNSYSYSPIAKNRIAFCAPLVTSATIDLSDRSDIFKPDSFHDEEASGIRNSFYAQLKIGMRARALPWLLLNDTLNSKIHTMQIDEKLRIAKIPPELQQSLLNAGIDDIIIVYGIESNHQQSVSILHTPSMMAPNGMMYGGMSQQVADIDIDFNYKCAIIGVKDKKMRMFIKMHESSSSPLNFYDEVCESLFEVLLYHQ